MGDGAGYSFMVFPIQKKKKKILEGFSPKAVSTTYEPFWPNDLALGSIFESVIIVSIIYIWNKINKF